MPIERKDFEAYETVILTEQMSAEEVPGFLMENTEFARWYLDRVPARMEKQQ